MAFLGRSFRSTMKSRAKSPSMRRSFLGDLGQDLDPESFPLPESVGPPTNGTGAEWAFETAPTGTGVEWLQESPEMFSQYPRFTESEIAESPQEPTWTGEDWGALLGGAGDFLKNAGFGTAAVLQSLQSGTTVPGATVAGSAADLAAQTSQLASTAVTQQQLMTQQQIEAARRMIEAQRLAVAQQKGIVPYPTPTAPAVAPEKSAVEKYGPWALAAGAVILVGLAVRK